VNVLSMSYALAPVALDAPGGAEVVLAQIDAALVARRHGSFVVAPEGSRVAGVHIPTPVAPPLVDDSAYANAHAAHREGIARALSSFRVDVLHAHGVDVEAVLPEPGVPTLVTLHLPPSFHTPGALERLAARPRTRLACVSRSQAAELPVALRDRVAIVENGVDLQHFRLRRRKHGYALALGRICPEKNFPAAIAAARRAGLPLILAGQVFPYETHQRHFREAILPELGRGVRWIGPVSGARKRRLLAGARCVLVPSLVAETSSLVAMEALASGTPVIAYPHGALPDIVEDGRTGWVVGDPRAMGDAITRAGRIDPRACRAAAEARFDLSRTVARWVELLEETACTGSERAA
jgi:glycosyltransferase involved in cell wall biosynthesis